jgi:hypothetical protein
MILDVDAVEEAVLVEHVPVFTGDATEIMLHSAAGWCLTTGDDSIGTTTGVSVISSCASLIKMLRMGVESGARFWTLGEQDGVCDGVDVIISISFGGTWISTISVTVVISVCRSLTVGVYIG